MYFMNATGTKITSPIRLVFKGNIEFITEEEIGIRLRATQQNSSVLPPDSLYAIEHDTMDTTFRSMYQALSAFASATKERRDLLLAQRMPEFEYGLDKQILTAPDDFTRVTLKALAAKDFFLLVGPPGTGKTSCALKKMWNDSIST